MLHIVVEWEWSVVQSISFSHYIASLCPCQVTINSASTTTTIYCRFGILLSSLEAVEPCDFEGYVCSKLLLDHRVWLSLYWSFFTHQVYAQMLVPFLVQTRFEQQSIFFLPSYSSSVFVPLNIVVSLNIVFWILYFDIIEYFHVICTNTAEGQAWKQASLCLPLDRSLWSTIKMYVINNMFVKQSWNKYWLIDWYFNPSL